MPPVNPELNQLNTKSSILFVVVKHTRSLGASEDLIVAAAEKLAAKGPAPVFWFNFKPPESNWRISRLRAAGCAIHCHDTSSLLLRIKRRACREAERAAIRHSLLAALKQARPARVVLNQGGNSDASWEAEILQQAATSYAVVSHSATASSWPDPEFLPAMRSIFLGANLRLFVSGEIRELTEAQIGTVLTATAVISNPCKFSAVQHCPWPDPDAPFSLAAVSRIENRSKGHDIIIRVLARPEWRERPLSVTFFGDGPHRQSLTAYAQSLGLDSVSFVGHVDDIQGIWRNHHGFIQASRYEGYGLSLVEAMFCQRMAITTPFPASREFIEDGETGFLARAATVEEMALALERAWALRDRWREMGFLAARRVDDGYAKDPIGDFVTLLEDLPE